jgi:protein-S-isoprenylcysteine O-methyltransferase Ste14
MNASSLSPAPPTDLRRGVLIRFAQLLVEFALFGVVLFVAAGTVAWPNAWAFLGLSLLLVAANGAYVLPRNPELIVERGRRHAGTRTFDTVVTSVYTVFYLGLFVVAGLDAQRFGWAPLSWGWAVLGGVMLVASDVPVVAAMAVNPYLETTVRIQQERGHEVIMSGPYRYVRHPMYVGMLVQVPATALLLGSAWALLPALSAAVALVVRTALEDRTLLRDLPGYPEYALRTRYRLVPGVW